MSQKQKKIIIIFSAVVLMLVALWGIARKNNLLPYAFLSDEGRENLREELDGDYLSAWQSLLAGNSDEAAEKYQKAMSKARYRGLGVPAKEQIRLALSKVRSNQIEEGLSLYKEIALDEKNTSLDRATAINQMAEVVFVVSSAVLEENLFSDKRMEPYYYRGDQYMTKENLLYWAASLNESAPGLYELAYYYAGRLYNSEEGKIRPEKKKFYKNNFVSLYRRAEEKFSNLDIEKASPDSLLISYLYKAKINEYLNMMNDQELNKVKLSSAETKILFDKAMNLAQDSFNQSGPEDLDFFARISYATFLNRTYPGQKNEEIKNVLAPVYVLKKGAKEGLFIHLCKEDVYTENVYHKKEILSLVEIDPRFANLLTEAEWVLTFEDK